MNDRKVVKMMDQIINPCVTGLLTTRSLEQAHIGNQLPLQPLTANTTGDPRSTDL